MPAPKALIVPHAGYVYSGPVAGIAFARLIPAHSTIRRVVVVGPSHRVDIPGLAASRATAFRTPLGEVELDHRTIGLLLRLPMVQVSEEAHAGEHSIEVQLPFLQMVLGSFSIVPLLTGRTDPEEVAQVLLTVWGGADTLIVISTDLTHYLEYDEAVESDTRTAAAILALDADAIGGHDACGAVGVRGLLLAARRHHLVADQLDLRNSGDTAGPRDRVVGYGAFALS
jgi:AmmeMemoRadiSam system protein B